MLKTGICSITMRQLQLQQLVALARQAGLDSIEWGGDVHVPPGKPAIAREARRLTEEAGLKVSSYGSYFRIVDPSGQPLPFAPVLDTALELGTDTIRIWAGQDPSDSVTPAHRANLVVALQEALVNAEQHGVRLALEFHANTLSDSNTATGSLMDEVNHPNLYTYWQPIYWLADGNYRLEGLRSLAGRVLNLHVFHWLFRPGATSWADSTDRRPLAEGAAEWRHYLAVPLSPALEHHALMEFVRGDDPAQFLRDAATLKGWCAEAVGPS